MIDGQKVERSVATDDAQRTERWLKTFSFELTKNPIKTRFSPPFPQPKNLSVPNWRISVAPLPLRPEKLSGFKGLQVSEVET